MLSEDTLHGVMVPVVTPFDRSGELDIQSFEELIRRLMSKGIHGLIVNGTAGESPMIESSELEILIAAARQAIAASRAIPLIVGIDASNTSATVRRMAQANSLGADAALVAAPDSNLTSQQAVIRHFQALAEADLPMILCDPPRRTGGALDEETVRVIMGMEHVIGLKEGSGNIRRMFRLARSMSKPVLCGEDELFFASLCCGAKGGILASANLDSEQFVQVYELFRAGKIEESHQLFHQLLPLVQFLFSEPTPAPLMWLLSQRGYIRSDRLRLPMAAVSCEAGRKHIRLFQGSMWK
ncbi:dihydrodipicolinate synthase family protein [Paenibacillus ehimensis]|uniref:dihydrodipicolinate synthase family protein n=1 Tax=Paenibacillus ehimensis TaxID=79264 RepID=UPI001FEBDBC2|nr:dihydrodipicolinate synthase family protein [Paenibacillus ehimensis]MEC0208740.1 dihydrodipicolinate synthase family protein [Paenibacillus ehimensis]